MLAQSEVRQLNMTILIKQNVVRLQVSVDVVVFVDRLDCENRLRDIESRLFLS